MPVEYDDIPHQLREPGKQEQQTQRQEDLERLK